VAKPQASKQIAITGGTLIDGSGRDPVKNATVLIEGERIVAVGPSVAVPKGAQVIDAAGRTVLPGIIDCRARHLPRATCQHLLNTPTYNVLPDRGAREPSAAA
jgi:imidazolonepropionase-like amidohydrolase